MDARKKTKLEADAMDVHPTGDTAPLVSLKTSATDKEILKRLRPVLLKLDPYADTASICTVLEGLEFLQLSPSSLGEQIDSILASLVEIYKDARRNEANKVPTVGAVEMHDLAAAIEIRSAVLHSSPVQIGETNLKIYQDLVPDLQNPGHLTKIIVRSEDEAFWNHCIEVSLSGHKVCGVGNPGIGKTTTTLYLLQQLIMCHKGAVVYTIRKPFGQLDVFYEFVPVVENDKVIDINVMVYKISNAEKRSKIPSLSEQGAFYVVDPGDYVGSCDDTSDLRGVRFIMAASNDSAHWGGNNFTKSRAPLTRNMLLEEFGAPPKSGKLVYGYLWTGYQLLVAKPYLDDLRNIHDDEILRRLRIVGGSLRNIATFEETKFNNAVATALNLDASTVQELAEGRHQFAFTKTAPSSVLIGVGPHDQDMENFKITLKSDYVEEQLAKRYLMTSWYNVLGEDNAGNRGNLFESYVRLKFSTGPVRLTKRQVRESKNKKPSNAIKTVKQNYQQVDGITLGAKRTIVRVTNMNEYVQKDEAKEYMVYSRDEREPLIDMIFRVEDGYDAIQATISCNHGAETKKIRTLKRELNLKPSEKLRIFFVVPWCRYEKFVTDPVNPLLDEQDLNKVSIYHVGVMAE